MAETQRLNFQDAQATVIQLVDYKNQVNNTTWTYYFLRSASFKYSQPRDDLEFMEDFYS